MAKQTFTTGQVLLASQLTSLQQTALGGGAATAKTASYVLVAADAGTTVAMNAAGSTTITVNTSLFAAGDKVFIQNLGAGVCTVTAGTATVSTSGSLVLAQNQGGELYFTSASASIFFQYATPASGDIEGVTAGTGISGGGTSGTVTVTNSMATAIDAKGDLIVGTGADAFSRLAVGTNTYLLTADSAEATGLKWAAPAAGASAGLVLISTTTFSGVSSATPASAPFSSTYDNYLFRFNNCTTSTGGYIGMRMRVGGVDYSATDYRRQSFEGSGTTGSFGRNINLTSFTYVIYIDSTYQNASQFELQNPFNTKITTGYNISAAVSAGNIEAYSNWWGLNTATSYDSFTILVASGTMSGSVSVYGFAK